MPTPDTIKAIILMDSPEPIQILRPGQVVERAKRTDSPYKLGLAWPAIQTHVLDHFYQQLAVCTASELNRFVLLYNMYRMGVMTPNLIESVPITLILWQVLGHKLIAFCNINNWEETGGLYGTSMHPESCTNRHMFCSGENAS